MSEPGGKDGLFITGTDTHIGKTVTSALLLAALARAGRSPGYFKPVQTGLDSDKLTVTELTGLPAERIAPSVYEFPEPIAPSRAAKMNRAMKQVEISLDRIRSSWIGLPSREWVVEGAGGLMVPLNSKSLIRDLILELHLRVLLVSSTRLGTINHTLLSVESARASGIPVAGIALVGEPDPGLEETIAEFTDVPVVSRIPLLPELSGAVIQEFGPVCFPEATLSRLFPSSGGGRG